MIRDRMREEIGVKTPSVIYNAPIIDQIKDDKRPNIREHLNLKQEDRLLIFIGKIYDIHNHDHKIALLINAVAKVPGLHFAMVGPVGDNAKKQLEIHCDALGITDRVHQTGNIPPEELVQFVKNADLGAIMMPPHSLNIAFALPNKFFEYINARMAFISFDLVQMREISEPYGFGEFFREANEKALSIAINNGLERAKNFTGEEPFWKELSEQYSWQAQEKSLVDIYSDLLPR